MKTTIVIGLLCVGWLAMAVVPTPPEDVRARVDADVRAGRPVVVHVVVALCDNEHQGIIPVPKALGDGQNPKSNLYWGAAYGVRTFFRRAAGWERVPLDAPMSGPVLDKAVFHRRIQRDGQPADAWLVAEAWDGAEIKAALVRFLRLAAGQDLEIVPLPEGSPGLPTPPDGRGQALPSGGSVDRERGAQPLAGLAAGGDAVLVVFVGHNGLMDFPALVHPQSRPGALPRAAVVLACASRPYFHELLRTAGAEPLLLTAGLMAPEAYALEAAVTAFARGDTAAEVREAAAAAYARYQKCGLKAARRLFVGE